VPRTVGYVRMMAWTRALKTRVNSTLRRATGYELQPARTPAPKPRARTPRPTPVLAAMSPEVRLLTAPVFIISSIRSGSTLLRAILGSHSQLYAPHELHLSRIDVRLRSRNARNAMAAIGLDEEGLEQVLWDRLLDRQLRLSGKTTVVNKTPSDAFIWRRIAATWPDARFVFLLRHPLSIALSRQAAYPNDPLDRHIARTLTFMNAVEEARQSLPGLTVRYEDLTDDPEAATRQICEFLGVPWERGMLNYGSRTRGDFVKGLGDWTDRIRSGTVQPARPLPAPDEVPGSLKQISRAWGYLPESD
jgi:hypothetical protein